jgi:hypothetical protein
MRWQLNYLVYRFLFVIISSSSISCLAYAKDDEEFISHYLQLEATILLVNVSLEYENSCGNKTSISRSIENQFDYLLRQTTGGSLNGWADYVLAEERNASWSELLKNIKYKCSELANSNVFNTALSEVEALTELLEGNKPGYLWFGGPVEVSRDTAATYITNRLKSIETLSDKEIQDLALALGGFAFDYSHRRTTILSSENIDIQKSLLILDELFDKTKDPSYLYFMAFIQSSLNEDTAQQLYEKAASMGDKRAQLWTSIFEICEKSPSISHEETVDLIKKGRPSLSSLIDSVQLQTEQFIFTDPKFGCSEGMARYLPFIEEL